MQQWYCYVLGLLLGFRRWPEKEEAEEERVAVSSQLAASRLVKMNIIKQTSYLSMLLAGFGAGGGSAGGASSGQKKRASEMMLPKQCQGVEEPLLHTAAIIKNNVGEPLMVGVTSVFWLTSGFKGTFISGCGTIFSMPCLIQSTILTHARTHKHTCQTDFCSLR